MSFLPENRRLVLITLRLTLLFIIAAAVLLPIKANDKQPRSKDYDSPVDRVYAALVQVASTRYNLKSAIKEAYTVNFFTGGQFSLVMSATCHDHAGKTIVILSISESERDPQVFFRGKARDDATKRFWSELDSVLNADENLDVNGNSTGPNTQQTSQQLQSGATVAIASTPGGAEIFVDENFVGNTPSSIAVPPGKHLISVRKQGYKDWERALAVSGGTVSLNAELVPGSNVAAAASVVSTNNPPQQTNPVVSPGPGIAIPARVDAESSSGWIGIATRDDEVGAVVISKLVTNGQAEKAGLRVGDVISELNGTPIKSGQQFDIAIAHSKPGSQVEVTYVRGESKSQVLVTVGKIGL